MIFKVFIVSLIFGAYTLPQLNQLYAQDLMTMQKKIIAELSGERSLDENKVLLSRSHKEQRNLARSYLSNLIDQLDLKPLQHEYTQPNISPIIDLLFEPFRGANVYTKLSSTNHSEEYIVLGAHFDTELDCPGAIDNATGVTLIYTVLKQLTQLHTRNKSVIVVFFDQEEEELNGSRAFAQFLKDKGLKIHSVHTFDTIGWDGDGDRAVELELPTQNIEKYYQKIAQKLKIPMHITKVNASDHYSFRALGLPVTGLTDEYVHGDFAPYKDTPKDTYDTVNFEYLASCTQLVFEVIKSMVEE